MSLSWPIWVIGGAALLIAGFVTAFAPRWRARTTTRQGAWLTAHAAIDTATISRDAAPRRVAQAEALLARAETIAAGRGGRAAALAATRCARRADQLWRRANNG